MNATKTNSPTTDTQLPASEKRAFFSTHMLDKKRTMKSLSLRPTRSVKKTTSIKPLPLKKA